MIFKKQLHFLAAADTAAQIDSKINVILCGCEL